MREYLSGREQNSKHLAVIRGFDLSKLELRGVTQEFPIFEMSIKDLRTVWDLGIKNPEVETTKVHMQQGLTVDIGQKNNLIYSGGANPCNIAVTLSAEGTATVMHSDGRWWTKKAKEIITTASTGIVGGGDATLQLHEGLYLAGSLQAFRPPVRAAGFNIALTMSNLELDKTHKIPRGIYFSYDSRYAADWDYLIKITEEEIRQTHNLPQA